MKPSEKKMQKSFTLIELLVVVAIIAILAGMLLPALNSAREKGRSSVCINNLNNIGKAQAAYTADHDGWILPSTLKLDKYDGNEDAWFMILSGTNSAGRKSAKYPGWGVTFYGDLRYYHAGRGKGGNFFCPSASKKVKANGEPIWTVAHYAHNRYLLGNLGGSIGNCARKTSCVKSASMTVFAADNPHSGNYVMHDRGSFSYRHGGGGDPGDGVRGLGSGNGLKNGDYGYRLTSEGSNTLYFDGHVKTLSFNEVLAIEARNGNENILKIGYDYDKRTTETW